MITLNNLHYIERKPKVQTEKAPLLLLIHGYGSNEEDLFSFANELPDEFHIVSVRGMHTIQFGGYAWYDIDFINMDKFNNIPQALTSRDTLAQFIDAIVTKENLDKENVYLTGFSQGAILCYAIALNYPEKVKNVICLSGYPEKDIIGEINTTKDFNQLNFFISHGEQDPVIPIQLGRKGKETLDRLKIKNEFHEYRSGHGIIPQNFLDMLNWIKSTRS